MSVEILQLSAKATFRGLPLVVRLALRELRSGARGFYVFMACLALGVAVITGVGTLADALRASFERQGEALLGGDVTLARPHKRADPAERAWLAARGRLSEMATLRAMARRPDGSEQALVEVKAVDAAYPLAGAVRLEGGVALEDAIHRTGGAAVDPLLLERLNLKVGDQLSIGKLALPITAAIETEPDRIGERLTYGPRVLVSLETLERTGLLAPGSLVTWRYALKLPNVDAANEALARFREVVRQALPEGGFTVRDRRDPSPQISRALERLREFLTLVGLSALLVGGVGVANAVATYIDRRRGIIAAFRSLGATSRVVFGVHLVHVLLIAALAVALGTAAGLLITLTLSAVFAAALPFKVEMAPSLRSIFTAAAYGILVSLLFTLWPLGRAERVRPAVLFRDEVAPERVMPPGRIIVLTFAVALLLAAFAVLTSEAKRLALYYCLGLIGVFAVFFALGAVVTWGARRIPRPRHPETALAIADLGAPGGLTRSIVLSLGAGLALLIAVALTDRSVVAELTERLPHDSPAYFVLDIRKDEIDSFRSLVVRTAPGAIVRAAPMLRGRLIALAGRPVEQIKAPPEAQWVLSGDRGLTYSETVPEGSRLVSGQWWPPHYDGEPLVSFEAELARALGLKVGDTLTVNVLGRSVTARIANLRDVKWESLALNFVLVFSPNTLSGAPHNLLATISLPKDAPLSAEAELARSIGRAFPATTAIRVKDALDAFRVVFDRVMTAVRLAGSFTLLAGALVLAGALATAQRRRIQQVVILKALGATRRRILATHLIEHLILGTLTAFISLLLGTLAAWITVVRVMELQFVFSFAAAAQALLLALGLVALFGGFGTWRVLKARPVPYLRTE
jgi:putative ABC transport system permease protein